MLSGRLIRGRAVHSIRSEDGLNVEPARRHRSGSMSGRVCVGDESRGAEAARNAPGALEAELGGSGSLRLGMLIASVAVVSPTMSRAAPIRHEPPGATDDLPQGSQLPNPVQSESPRDGTGSRSCICWSPRTRDTTGGPISKTFPDHPTFTFRSSHDGEYWFAVQTLTIDGKVSPTLDCNRRAELEGRGRHLSADATPGPGWTPGKPGVGALGSQG